MTEQLIVIDGGPHRLAQKLAAAQPLVVRRSKKSMGGLVERASGIPVICVAWSASKEVFEARLPHRSAPRLILMNAPQASERALLEEHFETVVAPEEPYRLLPKDQLLEVLASPSRADMFVGCASVPSAKTLLLRRGDLRLLEVPFSLFRSRAGGPIPDFSDVEVIDFGHAIRLGKFEASADGILYELDSDFRKREKANRIEVDDSIGGAVRRLRLQKGLSRDDFEPIPAKTIARIERGEVAAPHGRTLALIAKKLGVKPEELPTF